MDFTQQDLYNIVNMSHMLGNTSPEEQVDFIIEQIKQPFDSGNTNYFKKLKKSVSSKDELDTMCVTLFHEIENVYPNLEFDLSAYESEHVSSLFDACYKFFVKNMHHLLYVFVKEYLLNNKNRRGIVEDHLTSKLSSYPKEQYGKKEYYILLTKLDKIVKSIPEYDITLSEFIKYIERSDESPLYLDTIKTMISNGAISDRGVVDNIFTLFDQSDARPGILNKLEVVITETLVIPCLKENGLMDIRISSLISPDDDEDTSDTEDDE